jgi:hypothetical protein
MARELKEENRFKSLPNAQKELDKMIVLLKKLQTCKSFNL